MFGKIFITQLRNCVMLVTPLHGVLRRYLSLVCEYIYNVYRGVVLFMITWYQLLLVNIVIVMT